MVGVVIFISFKILNDFDVYLNISELDEDILSYHITEDDDGNYIISERLGEIADMQQGVFQILNNNTEVTAIPAEHSLPNTYQFTDLMAMKNNNKFHTWVLENGDILLFTEKTKSDEIMEQLLLADSFPVLRDEDLALIESENAIFTLYNMDGDSIFSTDDTDILSYGDIFTGPVEWMNIPEFKSYHILGDGSTALVRTKNEHYQTLSPLMTNLGLTFLKGIGIFHGVLLIVIIVFSILISRRFARPILYFLRRIERLAKNDYRDYQDKKLNNKKTGKLKRKYKIYEGIDQSLTVLTNNLISNEEQIKQTEKLREDWITGLSHDLKTPLSTVLGYSAMLCSEHNWSEDEVRKFSGVIEEKATYMDELINDLTYTYQLKNKGVHLDKVKVNMKEYLHKYVENNQLEPIKLLDNASPADVLLDEKRFIRVLENLIFNAVKYNPEGTSIDLMIHRDDGHAILEISDDGNGMSEEMVENLFNRYYRGTNTTSTNTGTGLGLTIAKQLVEAHDGDIKVISSEQGTTINISLPLA